MDFTDYCIIVLGDVDGVKTRISKTSQSDVRFIENDGLVIATFTSVMTSNELKTYFNSLDKNFLLFELGDDNYGVNLNDNMLEDHLFGKHLNYDPKKIMSGLMEEVNKNISSGISKQKFNIDSMGKDEQNKLLDKLLDKGVNNWNDEDKINIDKLTKKS